MSNTADATDVESIAAAEATNRGTPSQDVLRWLHETHHGVLSTLTTEKAVTGFPTGSIVPFALDQAGRPFIFIANIALHTRNLKKDNRASLFVHDGLAEGDPQSSWRISVLGKLVRLNSGTEASDDPDAETISDGEHEQLMARYVERVPKAREYAAMHGFHFWRMNEVDSIRYIAGFGRICSIPGSKYHEIASPEQFEKMLRSAPRPPPGGPSEAQTGWPSSELGPMSPPSTSTLQWSPKRGCFLSGSACSGSLESLFPSEGWSGCMVEPIESSTDTCNLHQRPTTTERRQTHDLRACFSSEMISDLN